MAKKLRFKEADLTDEQILEQNAPETTAIPATPEEVTQATENVPTVEAPSYNEVTAPEGSEDVTPTEAVDTPTTDPQFGEGISVQPETVSVQVQIPTQQLGQAIAMATGDVRTAETAPDIEAEKEKQAEEIESAEKENLVAEETAPTEPIMGEEPTEPSIPTESTVAEPQPIVEEPQPVHESLETSENEEVVYPEEMGDSYKNLMNLRKQRESKLHEEIEIADEEDVAEEKGDSYKNLMRMEQDRADSLHEANKNRYIDRNDLLSDIEKDKLKMSFENHPEFESKIDWEKASNYTFKDFLNAFDKEDTEALHEDVNLPKGSTEKEGLVEEDESKEEIPTENIAEEEKEPKKSRNLKALTPDMAEDENPYLPKGMGEDDYYEEEDNLISDFKGDNVTSTNDLPLGFNGSEAEEDFADRISSVLGNKDADDISAVADTLRATADYIDDYADEAEDVDDEEDFDEEPSDEKLDFNALLADDNFESDGTTGYEDDEDVADFRESMLTRMGDRFTEDGYSETRKYFKNIPAPTYTSTHCEDCNEEEDYRRPRRPYKTARRPNFSRERESINRPSSVKQELVKRPQREDKRMKENIDFNSIIFPAGSERVADEYRDSYNDDLVSAHEKVLEARNRAINDFHKSIRESRERYSTPGRTYRYSYREDTKFRPKTKERFREALNTSVRTSRYDERENANSWSNNRAIDKYTESQKFNFKELLKNGFLG